MLESVPGEFEGRIPEVRFREVQRFRQTWIWVLLLLTSVAAIGPSGYGVLQQLVLGKPWGDRPLSDLGLVLSTLLPALLMAVLLWFFWTAALVVEVRADAVHLHFRPLKRRSLPYTDVVHVEACRYRPIVQYGGWGIRRGRGGWAYNVSGDHGVRLDLASGKHVLIGSRRPAALAAAIATQREVQGGRPADMNDAC